jgi:hypothetical protein
MIFDHSALAAMGTNRHVARFIVQAHAESFERVFQVPAMCLAAAEAENSGLTRHVGLLPQFEVHDLTRRETSAVGALIALGFDWRKAHAVAVARNTGTPVVTLQPGGYASFGVETISLD